MTNFNQNIEPKLSYKTVEEHYLDGVTLDSLFLNQSPSGTFKDNRIYCHERFNHFMYDLMRELCTPIEIHEVKIIHLTDDSNKPDVTFEQLQLKRQTLNTHLYKIDHLIQKEIDNEGEDRIQWLFRHSYFQFEQLKHAIDENRPLQEVILYAINARQSINGYITQVFVRKNKQSE